MKNKQRDIPYLGVREEKIASLPLESVNTDSLDMFLHFVKERYKIHLRKDVKGLNPPYTKDPILKEFRFTNIRREHDRETKWLIKNIINNDRIMYKSMIYNCILFRLFNKHETSELISQPIRFNDSFDPEDYRSIFEERRQSDPKYVFFTGAFNTGGMKGALKWYLPNKEADSMEMRVMYFMKYLIDNVVALQVRKAESAEDVCNILQSYMGIGEFLAYQMFVDMTYSNRFPFSENEYTIAGPGAKLGLSYLFDDTEDLTPEELIFWLRDNWRALNRYNIESGGTATIYPDTLFVDLPDYDRKMNVMSLENCMCEFSKYYKTKNNLGRPRKKYGIND